MRVSQFTFSLRVVPIMVLSLSTFQDLSIDTGASCTGTSCICTSNLSTVQVRTNYVHTVRVLGTVNDNR